MVHFLVGQKGILYFSNWPGSLAPFALLRTLKVRKDFWSWCQFREICRNSSGHGRLAAAMSHWFALISSYLTSFLFSSVFVRWMSYFPSLSSLLSGLWQIMIHACLFFVFVFSIMVTNIFPREWYLDSTVCYIPCYWFGVSFVFYGFLFSSLLNMRRELRVKIN